METKSSNRKKRLRENSLTMFKYLITVIMMFMVVVIFANAVMRYVLNQGFASSEELGRFGFVWLSFVGMVMAYFQNKHAGVDFIAELFKGGKRLVFNLITDALVLVTLVAMLVGSILYYQDTWKLTSPATGIPYGYIYIAAIIAAILMIFKLFEVAKGHITDYKNLKVERGE